MKKQIIYLMTLATITLATSCKDGISSDSSTQMELHKKVYKASTDIGDLPTAINSLRYMIAIDSTNPNLLDTLANLYISVGQMQQAIKICDQYAVKYPLTEKVMETKELSFEKLDMLDSAYAMADKLFLKTEKLKYVYRQGYYKIQMGDKKGFDYLQKVIDFKQPIKDSTEMRFGSGRNSYIQMVPIKAAAYFIKGSTLGLMHKYTETKENYKLALKEFPEFYYVEQILQHFEQYVSDMESPPKR